MSERAKIGTETRIVVEVRDRQGNLVERGISIDRNGKTIKETREKFR